MTNKDAMENEYRVFKKALAGQLPVQVGFSADYHKTMDPDIGIGGSTVQTHLERMGDRGLIAGWAPILTEKGKARWDALRALYDLEGP